MNGRRYGRSLLLGLLIVANVVACGDLGQSGDAIPRIVHQYIERLEFTDREDSLPETSSLLFSISSMPTFKERELVVQSINECLPSLEIEMLNHRLTSRVRAHVAVLAIQYGRDRVTPSLLKILEQDRDTELCRRAAEGLCLSRNPSMVPQLVRIIQSGSQNREFALMACEAITGIHSPEDTLKGLSHDSQVQIRTDYFLKNRCRS